MKGSDFDLGPFGLYDPQTVSVLALIQILFIGFVHLPYLTMTCYDSFHKSNYTSFFNENICRMKKHSLLPFLPVPLF